MAICHPLSPQARSSTGQAKKTILKIWLISFVSAAPWSQYTEVNYLVFNNEPLLESAWCSIPFTEDNIGSVYLMLSYTLIYFIIPMITVTILYIRSTEERLNREGSSQSMFSRIGLSLHRRETLGEETVAATGPDNHQIDQAR